MCVSRIMYNIYRLAVLYVSSTNWRFVSNNNLNGNLTATLILASKILEPDQNIVSAVSVPARVAFFQICRLCFNTERFKSVVAMSTALSPISLRGQGLGLLSSQLLFFTPVPPTLAWLGTPLDHTLNTLNRTVRKMAGSV